MTIPTIIFEFLWRQVMRVFDFIRLRGKYGHAIEIGHANHPIDFKIQTDVIRITPEGIKTLIELHGHDIRKHIVGNEMMRAKLDSASIYFLTGSRELKILSLSGDIDDIITIMHRVAADMGDHTISQIRICCASNPHVRKALVKRAGAIKTGVHAEVIIRR